MKYCEACFKNLFLSFKLVFGLLGGLRLVRIFSTSVFSFDFSVLEFMLNSRDQYTFHSLSFLNSLALALPDVRFSQLGG